MIGPRQAGAIEAARARVCAGGRRRRSWPGPIAGLPQLLAACDIVCVTPGGRMATRQRLLEAARVYFALDGALDLPWLKARVQARRAAGAGIGWR